jgi:hypothetical protein
MLALDSSIRDQDLISRKGILLSNPGHPGWNERPRYDHWGGDGANRAHNGILWPARSSSPKSCLNRARVVLFWRGSLLRDRGAWQTRFAYLEVVKISGGGHSSLSLGEGERLLWWFSDEGEGTYGGGGPWRNFLAGQLGLGYGVLAQWSW